MAISADQNGIEKNTSEHLDRKDSAVDKSNIELDNDDGLNLNHVERQEDASVSSDVAHTGSPLPDNAENSANDVSSKATLDLDLEQFSEQLSEFNSDLATYTHVSWYDHWEYGEVMRQMRLHDRSRQYISEEIARLIDIDRNTQVEFQSSAVLKLAIADGKTVQQIMWLLGLVALGRDFNKKINGSEVRQLAKVIGRNSLLYSIKNSERLDFKNGNKYTISIEKNDNAAGNLKRLVIFIGRDVVGTILRQSSAGAFKRLLLKIPYAWSYGVNYDVDLGFNAPSAEVFLSELMSGSLDDTFKDAKRPD